MDVPTIAIEVWTRGPAQPVGRSAYFFPSPKGYRKSGLIAAGGDFRPETVLAAYRRGIFPWPHPTEEHLWFSPDPRAIIPLGGLHISRRLARTLRQGRFRLTLDAAFEAVVRACGEREEGTWITDELREGYVALHHLGRAHSFEVWTEEGELAGGLYGIGMGAMFGAESMFHRVTDASKVAMVAMMQHMERIGGRLVDVQVLTEHTESMGAVEISRAEYLRRLEDALGCEVDWRAGGTLGGGFAGEGGEGVDDGLGAIAAAATGFEDAEDLLDKG